MVTHKEILAIIPARGGSKSIPRKNIKLLKGIPLIAYSIAAGLQAKHISRVIVSTDDQEIAEVGRRWGAEVPFMRPGAIAQDETLDLPVFQHALSSLKEKENYIPDLIVQLRPTSPFRAPEWVDLAIETVLHDTTADSVRSIVPSGQNPYKMWRVGQKGYMKPLLLPPSGIVEPYNMPRQKLPQTYWQTGHIDVIRPEIITTKNSMSGEHILPLILDARYAIDLDTESDWRRAEWVIDQLNLSFVRPE